MANWFSKTLGSGNPSFIWLHGWGQDLHAMERLANLFANTGCHTLYDQPGFGKSPMLKGPLLKDGAGTADYADALATILRADPQPGTSQPQPHIFIGHSFGGRVAIQMGKRHPDLVKAIVLIAGAGIPQRRSVVFKLKAFTLKLIGRLARLSDALFKSDFVSLYRTRYGSADYRNAGPLRATFVRVVNENLTATATAVRAPVLLIYGSDDTQAPPEIGRAFEKALPLARMHELAGFDHWDILGRGAYQCEAHIRAFLNDLEET